MTHHSPRVLIVLANLHKRDPRPIGSSAVVVSERRTVALIARGIDCLRRSPAESGYGGRAAALPDEAGKSGRASGVSRAVARGPDYGHAQSRFNVTDLRRFLRGCSLDIAEVLFRLDAHFLSSARFDLRPE